MSKDREEKSGKFNFILALIIVLLMLIVLLIDFFISFKTMYDNVGRNIVWQIRFR